MIPLRTRIASLDELDVVAPLFDAYRQFYSQPADLLVATKFIRDRMQRGQSVIFLASSKDQGALGFCQIYPSFCSIEAAPIYVLSDLYVAPEARRTGAGTALLQAAEKHAGNHGVVRLDLTTAHTNDTAQALYESQGWERETVFAAYSKRLQS